MSRNANKKLHLLLVISSIKLWTLSLTFSTILACGTWDNPEPSMFSWWLDLPVTSVCLPAVSYEWGEFSLEEAYWKRVCILLCYICVKFPPLPMQLFLLSFNLAKKCKSGITDPMFKVIVRDNEVIGFCF